MLYYWTSLPVSIDVDLRREVEMTGIVSGRFRGGGREEGTLETAAAIFLSIHSVDN